jgi:hypothetical protein
MYYVFPYFIWKKSTGCLILAIRTSVLVGLYDKLLILYFRLLIILSLSKGASILFF